MPAKKKATQNRTVAKTVRSASSKKAPAAKKGAQPKTKPVDDESGDARKHGAFKKAASSADTYAKDPKQLKELIDRAKRRASGKASGPFAQIWQDLQTVFAMLRAYARGEYREIPYKVLVSLIAAIAYFVMPIDLIPDIIIPFGFLDDASVLGWAISQAKTHIDRFREWQREA